MTYVSDDIIIAKRNIEALYAALKHEQAARGELEKQVARMAEQQLGLLNGLQNLQTQVTMMRIKDMGHGATS
jgi:hypothetical protein